VARRRQGRRLTALALLLAVPLAVWLVLQLFVVEVFTVTAASMEPTLEAGDRVVVLRPTADRPVERGDVVVADVRGTFQAGRAVVGPLAGTTLARVPEYAYVVKRVIGLPGERVRCCDGQGRVTVDDSPLEEPYLVADGPASTQPFDVLVPEGRLWVMGDNRDVSEDSRAHLGSPGGGTLSERVLVGRVVQVIR
jgi:signal peptidase I